MPLQISTIRPAYNCTQDELYSTSLLIVDSYDANQTFFLTKKTLYTILFGTNLRTEILAAKALPDFQQRGAVQEAFKVQMQTAADTSIVFWQELESLIRDSFPANQFKTRREEAGSTHYAKAAGGDWESLSQLMLSGSTFITNHTTELTTGGMTVTFKPAFNAARTSFDTLFASFKGAEQSGTEQRETKINANNAFYKKITALCDDGKKYYRDNPAKRERFTFTKVLDLVSGTGSETISITIPAGSSITTDRVFANSPIINQGTVLFHVCAGSAACNIITSPAVNPTDQVSNTFGPLVTITNPNAATEAKASLRVVR